MKKLLVVDNDPAMRQVMMNLLTPEGYQLSSAADGDEAIDRVKHDRPNLILLDMRLPDSDSIDVLVKIKKILPESPVLLMCGFGEIESAVHGMKKGALNYICKPFKINEVLKMVRDAIDLQSLLTGEAGSESSALPAASSYTPSSSPTYQSRGAMKFVLMSIIITGIFINICLLIISYLSSQIKNETYTVPYSNPTAITYDGTHIWITDWLTQTFYQHNLDNSLTISHSYYIQGSHSTGIAFDGKDLWSSNAWESMIYKHKLDTSLSVIDTFQSPCPEPAGMYWDGVYFWICDMGQGKIYKTKIIEEGLVIVEVHDSPGNNPVGIFFDGTYYWIGDAGTNQIHKMYENFTVAGVYVTSQYGEKGFKLSSIGWDGKSIWTCGDESQTIHRDLIKSLKKINF